MFVFRVFPFWSCCCFILLRWCCWRCWLALLLVLLVLMVAGAGCLCWCMCWWLCYTLLMLVHVLVVLLALLVLVQLVHVLLGVGSGGAWAAGVACFAGGADDAATNTSCQTTNDTSSSRNFNMHGADGCWFCLCWWCCWFCWCFGCWCCWCCSCCFCWLMAFAGIGGTIAAGVAGAADAARLMLVLGCVCLAIVKHFAGFFGPQWVIWSFVVLPYRFAMGRAGSLRRLRGLGRMWVSTSWVKFVTWEVLFLTL